MCKKREKHYQNIDLCAKYVVFDLIYVSYVFSLFGELCFKFQAFCVIVVSNSYLFVLKIRHCKIFQV